MLGWYLSEIRREDILHKEDFRPSEVGKLIEKQKQQTNSKNNINNFNTHNPFLMRGKMNPWGNMRKR